MSASGLHVPRRTSCSIQSTATSVAFEVLGFLVGDEELEIFKVTFAY